MGDSPKNLYYDFRGLGKTRLELYVTVKGKIHRWLFDGKEWWLSKIFDVSIDSPFLICNDGNTVVTERDGDWCLIGPLDAEKPTVRRIVEKQEGEPLMLIEDVVTKTNYFEHEGTLLDENGKRLWSVPRATNTPERIKAIAKYVCACRRK